VLAVQRRANADLAAKNHELDEEQAKVQARFDTAVKAIEMFHTGVSEDALLKNPQLKELRTKLLKEAARFYADLEKLLAGHADARSRKMLAEGYFQLAELTANVGDQRQALALHRQALALRRELAAAPGADVATRLDVARSLWLMGSLLLTMGNFAEARLAHEEQRDLAEQLEALAATDAVPLLPARAVLPHAEPAEVLNTTDAVRTVLAHAHHNIGSVLVSTGKYPEALDPYRKALAIYQKLADANPGIDQLQHMVAGTYTRIGTVQTYVGKSADGLESHRKAAHIMQKLADVNPADTDVQKNLAMSYDRMGIALLHMGRPPEAVEATRKAVAIRQQLVDAHPAVIGFQHNLALSYDALGWRLLNAGKPVEGVVASQRALDIIQALIDENPTNSRFQFDLANFRTNIGRGLVRQKRLPEALTSLEIGLVIRQRLAKGDPSNAHFSGWLGESYAVRGLARARAGQAAEAVADLRLALQLLAKFPDDIEMQVERARVLAILAGLSGDAKSGITKDEVKAYADQAVAALAAAIKTGWTQPSELKESDFDAVRGRADFQKLVAEVEAKAKTNSGPKTKSKD
jgi:tetratricopeptide (TPR) repeat protein